MTLARADDTSFKGHFLVATPKLGDPMFGRAVILLLEHDDRGALGIIINRATKTPVARVFPLPAEARQRSDRVFVGGPVQPKRIFVLLRATEAPPAANAVLPDVYISTRQPAFDHAFKNDWPVNRVRVIAGYAGWSAGQLENEVKRGDWRFYPADAKFVFDAPPARLWEVLNALTRGQWAKL